MSKLFTLQITASKCNYQLRVNDIITIIETEGLNVDYEIPINHLILFGINKVDITLLPLRNEKTVSKLARLKVIVFEREHQKERETRINLAQFIAPDFTPKETTPPLTLIHAIAFENTDTFFKNDTWHSILQPLGKDEVYNQVVSFYKQFYTFMAAKNLRSIMALLQQRMIQYSTATYQDQNEFIAQNNEFYDSMFANENIIAWPLQKQKLILLDNFGSQLFTLKNEIQESPLIFYNTKEKESHYVDIFLGKIKNEKDFKIIL